MADRTRENLARRRPTLAEIAAGMFEAVVLAALAVVPLFFNPRTERIFEPDKVAWVICLAALAAWAAWAYVCATYDGDAPTLTPGAARPLIIASLSLGVVLLVSTAFSIAPAVSLWGSYRRGQGLFATLALIVLFGATANAARSSAARERILNLICITAMPVALYALLQRFGIDTIPWSQYGDLADVRAFGSLGNAILLGAYLAMVVPISLGSAFAGAPGGRTSSGGKGRGADARRSAGGSREPVARSSGGGDSLKSSANRERSSTSTRRRPTWRPAYLVMAGVAFAGLLASQSRGPVIGLAAGLAAGALLVAADAGRRKIALGAIGSATIGLALLVALGRAGAPGLSRFGTLLSASSRTAQERLLAWDALARSASADPMRALFGHGAETLTFVLPPFADTELTRLTPTQVFDRAHDVIWEWWVAAGLIGVVVYLGLHVAAFHAGRALLGWIGDDSDGRPSIRGAFWRSAASTLGSAALAAGAVAFVRPGLMGLAATFGAAAGLIGHLVFTRLIDVQRGTSAGPEIEPDGHVRPWWVVGSLAALIAHLVEGSLGIPTVVGELLFWVVLGVLAGGVLERVTWTQSASDGGAPNKRRARDTTDALAGARSAADRAVAQSATAEGLIVGLGLATITFAPLVLPFGLAAVLDGRNILLLGLIVIAWVSADLVAPAVGYGRRAGARLGVLTFMLLLLLPIRIYAAGPTVAFATVLIVTTAFAGFSLAAGKGSRSAAGTEVRREEAWRAPLALAGLPLAAIIVWLVALRPVIADAQLPAGLEAAARGDITTAAMRFNRAAELWPWQPSYAHYTAALERDLFVSEEGSTAARLEAFARAEATLERAFAMHPSEALARRRAMLHRDRADRAGDAAARRRDLDTSASWFQEALRREPNAPESHAEYATLFERMDDAPSARMHFTTALDINPNRIEWWIGLARAALTDNDVPAAGEAVDAMVALVSAERIDEVLQATAAEAEAMPVQPFEPLWNLRVRMLVEARTDRSTAALATLDELTRRAPNDPRLAALGAEVMAAERP